MEALENLLEEKKIQDHEADISEELDLSYVDKIVQETGTGSELTIPILQAIQEHYRYLPQSALERVCELTEITPTQIIGVSTFYSQFRHHPMGKHLISLCDGTACHVKGAITMYDAIRDHLEMEGDDDTDSDGTFTIQKVACLGCCTLAPVMQIDGVTYGHLTTDIIPDVLRDFLELQKKKSKEQGARKSGVETDMGEIRITLDSCCVANGCGKVHNALAQALMDTDAPAKLKRVACVNMCYQTPMVEIVDTGGKSNLYARVQPEDARDLILKHFKPKNLFKRAKTAISRSIDSILTDEVWKPVSRYSVGIRDPQVAEFLGTQKHIATENWGDINPTKIEEYLEHEGFEALKKCLLEMSPEDVIQGVQDSGLRGRGGAGFPTGLKWSMVSKVKGDVKYIICNGDEGDPGAFMDRMLLESYPYRVIEGIIIAAYAVGANRGYIYVRSEYPAAVQRVKEALKQCKEKGFLGDNILDSGFGLDLKIMQGAGAFVCGEETALLASIEGQRGMPRLRPPYPAQSGLWGKPTLVNNVETYSLVPWIIRNGSEEFSEIGTQESKGTKVFALAGKVNRGGLIEVPMGVSIREIVEEIGGGIADGRKFKAVQIGGPSGGCIPASLAHTPVDYQALKEVGAIMGSGGMVVLDDSDCMVEIARYFLEFTQDQSCGKCTFCRVGTRRMLESLTRLCNGEGKKGDIEELEQLAHMVQKGSLCGLGKTAPNPVLSTLKYFREEYGAHIEGRCPAGNCKALIKYYITDDCIGCTKCAQGCPADAIHMKPYEKHEIDDEKCTRCDACRQVCPSDAVKIE
ncbi:4Fe-4S dicluster domain-containing protein [Candidatus Poribacteria bacterium]|nr:4Fe-4S dicluster domain-containing protein [Candidatus Poribacteria bacterium]